MGDCTFEIAKWLQFDGYAYQLTPIVCPQSPEPKQMDVDKMYNLVMDGYRFESAADTTINFDYFNLYAYSSVTPVRDIYNQVALKLVNLGRSEEAEKVLDRCYEMTPAKNIPLDVAILRGGNEYEVMTSIDLYLTLGCVEKAKNLSHAYIDEALKSMRYSAQEVRGAALDAETIDRELQYATYLANLFRSRGYQDEYDYINNGIKALLN